MLKSLVIKNGFVHQNRLFNFKDGQTAIVGKNGRGKSLITEMGQFGLWGSKALRGDAEDYKKLEVHEVFEVKGKDYMVQRTTSKALLMDDHGTLASGTKAVNAAIEKLFGYSYDVFQIANAANQGEIAKLSAMGGPERKRMVDKTIGLDVIDGLEKFVSDKLKTLRAQADGLRGAIVAPVAPEPPENYGPTEGLQKQLDELRGQDREADLLRAVALVDVEFPRPYETTGEAEKLGQYRMAQVGFIEYRATRKAREVELARLPAQMPEAKLHPQDADLATLEAIQKRRSDLIMGIDYLTKMLDGIPRDFKYTSAQLTAMMDQWDLRIRWVSRNKLREELVTYHCPNCDHEWHDEDPRLADYKDVPEEVEEPSISYREVVRLDGIAKKSEQFKEQFETRDKMVEEGLKLADHTALILEIYAQRKRHEAYTRSLDTAQRRAEIERDLAQPEVEDCTDLIARAESDQKSIEQFNEATKRATEAYNKKVEAETKLQAYPENLKLNIAQMQDQLTKSAVFNQLMTKYHVDFAKFREQKDALVKLEDEALEWNKSREALKDTRSSIKVHLLPSLNRVTSHLVEQMTGGDLKSIYVDEDFEIRVDGQKIQTLSGAGKDVSNLALRLGLGMVLTNRTFSSLWLDEIDAGCDDDRAEYISKCLQNLTKTFKQIIVISHKPTIVSDHRIEL